MKTKVKVSSEAPESVIVRLARKGLLAATGARAIKASHRKGLSVTILENGKIYRVYPDGSRKFVKAVALSNHTYTTGKLYIR